MTTVKNSITEPEDSSTRSLKSRTIHNHFNPIHILTTYFPEIHFVIFIFQVASFQEVPPLKFLSMHLFPPSLIILLALGILVTATYMLSDTCSV